MTPDVNVMVAASRSDHPHHRAARAWLESALAECAQGASFRLMPMVAASFLRLVTSPRIFVQPTPTADAVGFIDAVLAVPGVEMAVLGPEWPRLRQLCIDHTLGGNHLPDAWLAAAVVQSGERLASFDRDFKRLLASSQLTLLDAT
ncbi:VapC toxin family PIN domain ribonuclease [Aquincola sp. S2]|uniref:Ribonuclease VapC n=1 Tax=Pseudaquabacterium terrae TaxID=2732868 RepID=A0ABX2ESU4_9BURK|nr:TA system VapC family ribonuclease toxin [Aquabacterium terrae]NRF71561.1 VapC toxin family PIN domain ribonuclease [Aquabacterium terrae]